MLSVTQEGNKYPFLKSLVCPDLGLNPGLPDHCRTFDPLGPKIEKQSNPKEGKSTSKCFGFDEPLSGF